MSEESESHLITMANDIGHFFQAEPKRSDAIDGIANHINKFWTRRMRQKLIEQAHGAQLDELPRAALSKVNVAAPAAAGSAGATVPKSQGSAS